VVDALGARAPIGMNRRLQHLAVDLTPLQPGGANGGAKPLALELVRGLAAARPSLRITLLTLPRTREELGALSAGTLSVRCVEDPPTANWTARFARGLMSLRPALPWMHRIGADLLFCPFTAPFFAARDVPTVSLIHDLQHRVYPEFFLPADCAQREDHVRAAVQKAVHLVAASEYVKSEIIRFLHAPADQIAVIPHGSQRRFGTTEPCVSTAVLNRLGLSARSYYLYPANFWPHKNHRMLLVALARRQREAPSSEWKVVFTGAEDAASREILSAARAMGLGSRVLHAGFLADNEFASLLASARALLFPSLYEGFGMPVAEAMEMGVPVLCSNTTGLPEVAGDAALLFDPRKPVAIAAALAKFENESGLAGRLAALGTARARRMTDTASMAQRYSEVFEHALLAPVRLRDGIDGVYADHWTKPDLELHFAAGEGRRMELELFAPPWLPHPSVAVRLRDDAADWTVEHQIGRGASKTLAADLAPAGGSIRIRIRPVFQPSSLDDSTDTRRLGVQLTKCRLLGSGSPVDLHPAPGEPE